MRIVYECDICGSQYETEQECLDCEARGTIPPKYQVGDVVYKKVEYKGDDPIWIEVIVTEIKYFSHRHPEYRLNKTIFTDDLYYDGYCYSDWADEWELHRIGDEIYWEGGILSLEDITHNPPNYIFEDD